MQIGVHGTYGRQLSIHSLDATAPNGDPGKYGRIFQDLAKQPLLVPDDVLEQLANAMVDDPAKAVIGDNAHIPAGYTYFGQFVDHDVTFDTTPLSQQNVDPYATKNFRTPCLDLDSIYAEGPSVSPHLYARDPTPPFKISNKFLIGRTEQTRLLHKS